MDVPLPRIISEMSEEEREERVKEFRGFLNVDDGLLYANGWVNVEVENYDFPFYSWKTWSSISRKKFLENLEEFSTGKVIEFSGKLEEELLFYPNSKGLKTKTLIQLTNEGIIVEIIADEESELKEDQSKAITEKRMIEIMQVLHHNPRREERQDFEKPFKQRFLEEITNAEKEYIANKKDFVINLSTGMVLLQIVSNKMLETNRIKKRGFGLHLSFDEALEESIVEIAKFKSKEYSKEFDYHNLDGIPTYQIDLGIDKKRLEKLVNNIVSDVYEEEIETIEVDSFKM